MLMPMKLIDLYNSQSLKRDALLLFSSSAMLAIIGLRTFPDDYKTLA